MAIEVRRQRDLRVPRGLHDVFQRESLGEHQRRTTVTKVMETLPPESEQLALAQAGRDRRYVERLRTIASNADQELLNLIGRKRLNLLGPRFGRVDQSSNVPRDQPPLQSLPERAPQDRAQVLDGAR